MSGRQTQVFLQQKFKPPQPRVRLTQRQNLLKAFNDKQHYQLTSVVAPAGFGKSTLMGQFFNAMTLRSCACVWLALDPSDNEANRFFHLLCHALVDSNLAQSSFINRAQHFSATEDTDRFLAEVIKVISSCDTHIYWFVDDFHYISDPAVISFFDQLMRYCPDNFSLVLASRIQPPLEVGLLMAQGQMLSIDSAQLKFDLVEARALFGDVIPKETLEGLYSKTEGWIVAMQLMQMWLQQSPQHSMQTLGTQNVEILNRYFSEQIFERFSPELQEFVIHTSLLDRFNPTLANHVCEAGGGEEFIKQLEPFRALVIPIDFESSTYRYHHLFGDFLQQKLLAKVGEQICNQLRCKAARFYAEHDYLAEAVSQCIRAGEMDLAVELISDAGGWEMIMTRGIGLVESLLAQFDETSLVKYPCLGLMQAYLCMKLGRVVKAEEYFNLATVRFNEITAAQDVTQVTERDFIIIGLLVDIYLDKHVSADVLDLIDSRLNRLDEGDHLGKGVLLACQSLILNQIARFRQAEAMAIACEQEMQLANCWVGLNYALLHHGQSLAYRGQLLQALEQFERAASLAEEHYGKDNGLQAMSWCLAADIHYQRNELDKAQQMLNKGLGVLESRDCWHDIYAVSFRLALNLALASNDKVAAEALLTRIAEVASNRHLNRLSLLCGVLEAKTNQHFGSKLTTDKPIPGLAIDLNELKQDSNWLALSDYLELKAKDALARNAGADAQRLATKLHAHGAKIERQSDLAKALAIEAIVLEQRGEAEKACEPLNRMFEICALEGYIRVFIDGPNGMISLLKQNSAAVREYPQFVDLLETVEQGTQVTPGFGLSELGLSHRESQIAPLLARGLSNKQISQHLGISDNTVKFHLKNLFSKLKVATRTEAVSVLHPYL
ncbi:LuxR C-terminal-related transcriptional regulator [Shewanella submarina]|uniref:LuxR C-terminal-related transcriptional regulator n=1 Tax=Shewanella submarina TaxID=2016376 RepID=A0ABV7GDQ0_9GAMM|nr:LuxR C-terminal-related transcriptional regulator [Shewanella submarina]MCL1037501.1 LuxR C-terminal-related transcriptional regulator [Shewanella submarina]